MDNRRSDYLDLNQENVLTLYKECLIPKEDLGKNPLDEYRTRIFTQKTCGKDSPEVVFSNKAIDMQSYNIAHLLGQLKVTHAEHKAFTLAMGFIDFDNKPWTKDNTTLMALYYLGVASSFMPQFKKLPNSNELISTTFSVVKTYPKSHPNFVPLIKKEPASLDDDQ